MNKFNYDRLQNSSPSSFEEEQIHRQLYPTTKRGVLSKINIVLAAALVFSVAANGFLSRKIYLHGSISPLSRSPYAGLLNNLDVPFEWNTKFSGENYTEVNKLWYEDQQGDEGIIALDNSYAEEVGLPASQPFSWDAKTKSIYIVNGHHNLHCLRNIYISLDQFRTNTPQTLQWPHVLHCLDTLRSDIICNADDTPRFTEKSGKRPGVGQNRKCRDWSKLQEYVQQHSGCFKYIEPGNTMLKNIERVKFCPNDSPYLPLIRKYFGLPNDWLPWPEVE